MWANMNELQFNLDEARGNPSGKHKIMYLEIQNLLKKMQIHGVCTMWKAFPTTWNSHQALTSKKRIHSILNYSV